MRTKRSLNQRLLAALMVLCTLLTYLPAGSVSTSGAEDPVDTQITDTTPAVVETDQDVFYDHVKIYCGGEEFSDGELAKDQHLLLTAQYDGDDTEATYTWQIYSPDAALWVRIGGEETAQLQVGYALLAGMLNDNGAALLNCKVSDGNALYYSNTVQLTVVENGEAAEPAPVLEDDGAALTGGDDGISLTAEGDTDGVVGGELVTHTVTVKYVDYLTGMPVHSDFVATVQSSNPELVLYPDCPTVVGYSPAILTTDHKALTSTNGYTAADVGTVTGVVEVYNDGNGHKVYGIPTASLELNMETVPQDQTYVVYYLPNKVSYTVNHYIQNVNNDEYTLHYVQVLEGYVGTYTDATDLTTVTPGAEPLEKASLKGLGFISLVPFLNQEIAVDGTTQIDAYYDRAYFLMTFKLEGGTGVDPVYARSGSPVTIGTPTRQGYDFAGWVALQMGGLTENDNPYYSTPVPAQDKNGDYVYLYIVNGEPVTDTNGNMVTLKQDQDGNWYRTDTNVVVTDAVLTSAQLPTEVPAFHSAYQALWTEGSTHYSVIYWLEQADYSADPTKAGYYDEASKIQYDYWHSVTVQNAQTGATIQTDALKNPIETGAYAANKVSKYALYPMTGTTLDALDGKSFAIRATTSAKAALSATSGGTTEIGLAEETFTEDTQVTQWTFHRVGTNQYQLESDGRWMIMGSDGVLRTGEKKNASTFEITVIGNTNNHIRIKDISTKRYIVDHRLANAQVFRGYDQMNDEGNPLQLYTWETTTEAPADMDYYYWEKTETTTESVAADGTTVVNVFYRRREYNLRFFYGRSKTENGTTTYEVAGGSTWGFSDTSKQYATEDSYTTTSGLLSHMNGYSSDIWGTVEALPQLNNSANYYVTGGEFDNTSIDGYVYHYFTTKARYGQNIADEWPSEVMGTTVRTYTEKDPYDPITKETWTGQTVVFSAWNGEFWLKYSREQDSANGGTGNYTIKGNYQQLDEHLLYDSSFPFDPAATDSGGVPYGHYYERGTAYQYVQDGETKTATRYLDFVAFFENGSSVGWSVPKQYHYYLWTEYDTTGLTEAEIQALQDQALKPVAGTMTEGKALPQGIIDFEAMKKGETYAYVNDTLYVLYDKVDCCDDSENPTHQTVPGVPGYKHIEQTFATTYQEYSAAMSARSYAYINTDWDEEVYLRSYSIHFIYEPIEYVITLSSGGYTKDIPTDYGTMTGAYDIRDNYWATQMEEKYYPRDLEEGTHVFAGWYKSPGCEAGTEAKLDRAMPNYNIILYAKWVPRNYSVEMYQTSEQNTYAYYLDTEKDTSGKETEVHSQMYSLAQMEEVANPNFPGGTPLKLPVDGAGKAYGTRLPEVVAASGPDITPNEDGTGYTISENVIDASDSIGDIDPNWIFVCWAYMDSDGVEHAIDVNSFTVTEDVKIYAKWTAQSTVYYRIDYQLADVSAAWNGDTLVYTGKDENGESVTLTWGADGQLHNADGTVYTLSGTGKVADSLTGRRNEGVNRTFNAKSGDELDAQYRSGYFPLYASHTLLMRRGEVCDDAQCQYCQALPEGQDRPKLGEDENHPLVQTFYYIPLQNTRYTVKYLDNNGQELAAPVTYTSDKIVATVNFKYIKGYTADAFQKTRVLSADPDENVIIFYYTAGKTTVPYTVIYYVETLDQDLAVEPYAGKSYTQYYATSGTAAPNSKITVDYRTISGFEYFADVVTRYTLNDSNELVAGTPDDKNRGSERFTWAADTVLELTDIRGDTATLSIVGGEAKITCTNEDTKSLHEHSWKNSVFYFTHEGVQYELRGAKVDAQGHLVVEAYYDPSGSFEVDLGAQGAVIKVYYDLKTYPYFIYHEAKKDGETATTVLGIELGKGKLGSEAVGNSWDDAALITKGYPGYTVDKTSASLHITITIENDEVKPEINTMTFYYHERTMVYTYQTMVKKNGTVSQLKNDPNASLRISSDPLDAVTDTAESNYPIYNGEVYKFVGWYADVACTIPAVTNNYAAVKGETLTPLKLTTFQYMDGETAATLSLSDANAFYAGVFNESTYTYADQQTFYALFVPLVGELTITRSNIGADMGQDEANSFVYTVSGTTNAGQAITMQVTIGPGEDSVTIYNLPFGTYTVTQENDWSWRYGDAAKTVTLGENAVTQTVLFDDAPAILRWLSGFAQAINPYTTS